MVRSFGIIFWKFAHKGSFFKKKPPVLLDHSQQFRTSGCDFSKMITNLGKSWQVGAPMECWLSVHTVGINSKSFPWPVQRARERTFQCPVWLDFTYLKLSCIPFQILFCFYLFPFAYRRKVVVCKIAFVKPAQNSYIDDICRMCVCDKMVCGYHRVRYTYMSICAW